MLNRLFFVLMALLLFNWLSLPYYAVPGRAIDLDKLTEESTLIVTGDLSSMRHGIRAVTIEAADVKAQSGVELSAPRMKAFIDEGILYVDQVLKGVPPARLMTIDFTIPEEFIGWIAPGEGYGVFFFRLRDGKFELTDPQSSWFPSIQGLSIKGSTLVDRVIHLLGDTLSSPAADLTARNIALRWLIDNRSVDATNALIGGLADPNPELSLNVANVLMQRGNPAGMPIYKILFLPGPSGILTDFTEQTAANSLALLRDPNAIPDLEELLSSSSIYIRRGSATALSKTGTPRALNGLRKALEDSDLEVRYHATVGLADVTGQSDWRTNLEEYKTDESKYLNHWREWARHPRKEYMMPNP